MKKFIVLLLLFPFFQLNAQHQHDSELGKVVGINDLLIGFDEDAALQLMNEKNISESEKVGYMRYLKIAYIKKNHPEFNFSDKFSNPYSDFKPELTSTRKSIYCTNANFENYNFTNWSGGTSTYGAGFPNTNIQSNGLNAGVFDPSARHTITTTPPLNDDPGSGPIVGFDPIAINPGTGFAEIPLVAPNGGVASCRLGNGNTGAEIERIYYDMAVTSNNTTFYYQFAIVLQDPSHSPSEQPYFKITVTDQLGAQIGGVCGVFNVNATLAATDPTFVQTSYGGEPLYYRPWELVSVDLSAYIGTTVRIQFESADCSQTGHFGYAYVDAGCGILGVASSLCSSDDSALIIAPAGFNTYQWSGPNDDNLILSGETDDSLFVSNPVINDTFYVNMESASGCISEIQTVLEYTTVTVGQLIVNNSCPGGASGNATIIAQGSTQGYNYLWTPGNFTTPTVTNLAPGVYNVHVESIDPACGTLDTFVTIGTNPIIPSQSTSDFCNANSVDIVAPLGSNFQWYNPSGTSIPGPIGINDSINVSGAFDGQNYTVTYLSSTSGCMDSTIITLNQIFPSGVIGGNIGSCGAVNLTYNFADNPTFTYEINGPSYNNVIANTSNNSINLNGLLPGSYVVTVLDGSCLSSSSFDISYTVSNTPINTAICPLGTQTLTSSSSGTHNWTDPNGIQTSTGASQVFTFPTTPPLAGIYTDTTTIISGCIEISVFNVTVTPTVYNPVVDLLPCPLDDFAVTSNSSGTHFWTDPSSGSLGSTTTTTFTINNILEGIYTDSTVTTAGCVVISNYDVTYDTILTNTTNSNIICYGDTNAVATVTVVSGPTGTYSYDWSGPLSYVAIGTSQTDLFAGTFIIYTENGNCNTTDTIVITSPSMPNDTLEITGAFCTYDPNATLFGPEGFTNYQWYFNNTPIIGENEDSIVISNLLQYTGYSVSYDTPPNGCTRFTTFINRTNTGPLFLPSVYNNVFTPNSDNVNEKYFPFYSTDFSIAEIQYYTEEFTFNVYNRWGELMYTSNSYSEGWDGKTNGKECSEGVYYWSLYFNPHCDDEASQITEVTGTVHLMR